MSIRIYYQQFVQEKSKSNIWMSYNTKNLPNSMTWLFHLTRQNHGHNLKFAKCHKLCAMGPTLLKYCLLTVTKLIKSKKEKNAERKELINWRLIVDRIVLLFFSIKLPTSRVPSFTSQINWKYFSNKTTDSNT